MFGAYAGFVSVDGALADKSTGAIPTIGWREMVTLPALGVGTIKAKVDTGARTSALDADEVEILRAGRTPLVTFTVPHEQDGKTIRTRCEEPLLAERWIISSDGRREFRPVIQTELQLGDQVWSIEVTLTSRAAMGFHMLLGREAIRKRFLVDPGRSFLSRGKKKTAGKSKVKKRRVKKFASTVSPAAKPATKAPTQ
ncbi:MAG: RimK/LysX family protein [Deltaproteobacteria bacterium]|nr:RimK/LysX family protein [Deltaproteobacteria bacterium]